MKHSCLRLTLGLALALAASTPWAIGLSAAPPPPAPHPMAASVDTTDWIVVDDALRFVNGKIIFCSKQESRLLKLGFTCLEESSLTPQAALAKIGPEGAQLTGLSPYFTGYGALRGMILYYKRAEPTR